MNRITVGTLSFIYLTHTKSKLTILLKHTLLALALYWLSYLDYTLTPCPCIITSYLSRILFALLFPLTQGRLHDGRVGAHVASWRGRDDGGSIIGGRARGCAVVWSVCDRTMATGSALSYHVVSCHVLSNPVLSCHFTLNNNTFPSPVPCPLTHFALSGIW